MNQVEQETGICIEVVGTEPERRIRIGDTVVDGLQARRIAARLEVLAKHADPVVLGPLPYER